jgi:hypothetical protein
VSPSIYVADLNGVSCQAHRHKHTEEHLIKGDFGGLLRHIHILVEGAIRVMSLLLDRRAELEEVFGHVLVRCLEHIDQADDVLVFVSMQGN